MGTVVPGRFRPQKWLKIREKKKKKMNFYIEENGLVSDVNREPTRPLGTATKACPPLCRGFEVGEYREADRTPPTPEARGQPWKVRA